ncbi:MAG: matrixin family metalloprotease [Deltaproteobacteria bacterium]|nr:matrixin family metalloprotease [Deltaproteobacteria bacterium]
MTTNPAGRVAGMVVVAVVLLAHTEVAQSYNLRKSSDGKVLIWSQEQVEVVIDVSAVPTLAGAADAVRAGFAAWTSAGVPVRVVDRMAGGATKAGNDGQNVVRWVTANWPYGKEVVAMTVSSYKASTGFVSDADVLLNAVHHRWATAPKSNQGQFDVQNVVTHEAGHFFGMAHDSAHAESAMYPDTPPGETKKRGLSADDRAGIAALVEEINRRRRGQAAPVAPPKQLSAQSSGDGAPTPGASGEVAPAPDEGADPVAAGGCAVGARGAGPGYGWLALLAGVLALRRRRLVVTALLLLAPFRAGATVVQELSVEELARASEVVVDGQVVRSMARRVGGMIVTDHEVRVARCLKGACSAVVVLRTLGGVIGDEGMHVEGMPKARPGQQVVLFGRRDGQQVLTAIGLAQGLFERVGSQALRDLRGLQLLEKVQGGAPQLHEGRVERIPLVRIEALLGFQARGQATTQLPAVAGGVQ